MSGLVRQVFPCSSETEGPTWQVDPIAIDTETTSCFELSATISNIPQSFSTDFQMTNGTTSLSRDEIIAKATEQSLLQPFPANALKLIQLGQDPNCQVQEIVDSIELEPVLAARTLAVANSPIYGYSRQITSVSHAVVVLGIRNVTQLIASFATDDLYKNDAASSSHCKALYEHALGCGLVARALAEFQDECDGSTAFILGLLHDIGKLILFQALPDEYATIIDQSTLHDILTLEQQALGLTHEEIGGLCARSWGFPNEIVQTIATHHGSDSVPLSTIEAQLVEAANWITVSMGVGSKATDSLDAEICEWNPILAQLEHDQRLVIAEHAAVELAQLLTIQ